ncbi:MAG TPA: CHAP domain-containing protein [Chitinophagaceae bacterium]|nr:CHAP domain-containing protein [Chitinophagaceae bacterium]
MTLREKALEIAKGEIGNQEIPLNSNDGPHVKKYLTSVNLKPPQFWCMAFVIWCFSQAAVQLGTSLTILRTGHVMTFYRWVFKNHPEWIVRGTPMPGDIGIMEFANDHGHTFIVEAGNGSAADTIEGNSNDEGSRNGYKVAHRTGKIARHVGTVKCFIRIPL